MNKAYMSSLRLIYIKRIAYTVAGLSSIQVYTENEGRKKVSIHNLKKLRITKYFSSHI